MKKSETVEKLREFLKTPENRKSEKIIDFLVSCGMRASSRRTGFCGVAHVSDWEENITERDWDRAFDSVGRD